MFDIDIFYFKYRQNDIVYKLPQQVIDYYDLTIVINGCLEYIINGRRYTVSKNNCIFIPQGSKRFRFEGKRAEYVSFNFNLNERINLPLLIENCLNEKIKRIISACTEYYFPYETYSKNAIENLTKALLFTLLQHKTEKNYNHITKKILNLIEENYSKKLSLNEICNKVGYTPTYCDSVFKKDINKTIINYLLDFRMAKAKELLMDNKYSHIDIAKNVGFDDYNYFSRFFKKKTGQSPLHYKIKS